MAGAMTDCVLLADRHQELSDGVRGLLRSMFEGVFAVVDKDSLLKFATLLQPQLVVCDLSLASGDVTAFLHELKLQAPAAKALLLSVHDEPTVISAVLAAGADGVVLKRDIATDFADAVEAVLAGRSYSSSPSTRQRPVRVSQGDDGLGARHAGAFEQPTSAGRLGFIPHPQSSAPASRKNAEH